MREAGVEPARPCEHWHLKPASLPIPPLAQVGYCSVQGVFYYTSPTMSSKIFRKMSGQENLQGDRAGDWSGRVWRPLCTSADDGDADAGDAALSRLPGGTLPAPPQGYPDHPNAGCRWGAGRRTKAKRPPNTNKRQPNAKAPSGCAGGGSWWRRTDSNHRRQSQQIYSLSPLATWVLLQIEKVRWSWWTDSNPRPADYKSAALPAELHQRSSAHLER